MTKDLTTTAIGEYKQHPIAIELMPGGMDEQEFTAFCEDIEQRGIIMPVTLYEDKVLDGWHRYRAAHKTGTPFKTIVYTGKDPAGYIAAVNVLRRKLSSLQRALVGARLHLFHNLTQREVCKKLGISNEVVTLVLKTLEHKNATLIKRIETDSDFTRGLLKEELTDAGLLRAKPASTEAPKGPNSVFDIKPLTGKEGTVFRPDPTPDTGDTDGINDEDGEDDDEDLLVGKGKAASDRAARKPKATAAQLLADGFQAMVLDDKLAFLKIIAPTVNAMVKDGYDTTLVERTAAPPAKKAAPAAKKAKVAA